MPPFLGRGRLLECRRFIRDVDHADHEDWTSDTDQTHPARRPPPGGPPITIGDLLKRLGGIPAGRVRLKPTPGTATEKDVIEILDRENRLFELVDGTLVEKPMGYEESEIACLIITALNNFVRPRKLGIVTGPDGTIRLFAGLVRMPDVAFASWDRFPGRKRPKVAIPNLAPELAVEVLSKSNTQAEMKRKLEEYFDAGVRAGLDGGPQEADRARAHVGRAVGLAQVGQSLDGGDVLPGFTLALKELFEEQTP